MLLEMSGPQPRLVRRTVAGLPPRNMVVPLASDLLAALSIVLQGTPTTAPCPWLSYGFYSSKSRLCSGSREGAK